MRNAAKEYDGCIQITRGGRARGSDKRTGKTHDEKVEILDGKAGARDLLLG